MMIRDPEDFKVYRATEGDPEGPKDWRRMRKGIADLHRRAVVSQAANERHLEALAAVHDATTLRQMVEPLCQPATEPARRANPPAPTEQDQAVPQPALPAAPAAAKPTTCSAKARRVRALNPLGPADAALLQAASHHEFLINGLRNRDLRRLLYGERAVTAADKRRHSAAQTETHGILR